MMRALTWIFLFAALACSGGGGGTGPTTQVAPYIFTEVGRVLGPSDIGQAPGEKTGTADPSAVELPDKRIRLYFGLFTVPSQIGGRIGSAISSDGTHFTVESGTRDPSDATLNEGFSSPLVFPLPGGGYRLFYNGCHPGGCGESSATSSDGLTFVSDPGLRFPSPIANDQPACGGIAKRADGTYRMYCSAKVSSTVVGSATLTVSAVFSAVSSDLLAWTVESGFRIGPGAPSVTGDANHPTPIVNQDGSVSIVYNYNRPPTIATRPVFSGDMIATSKDGLAFDSEIYTGIIGSEPAFLKRADGSLLLYHGNHTATDGSTIDVASVAVR
jgi:hypothetical protein